MRPETYESALQTIAILVADNAKLRARVAELEGLPAEPAAPPVPAPPKTWRDLPHTRDGKVIVIGGRRMLESFSDQACSECAMPIRAGSLFKYRCGRPVCQLCVEGL